MELTQGTPEPGERAGLEQDVTWCLNWLGFTLFDIQEHEEASQESLGRDCHGDLWCLGDGAYRAIQAADPETVRILLAVALKMLAQLVDTDDVEPENVHKGIGFEPYWPQRRAGIIRVAHDPRYPDEEEQE